MKMKQNSEKIQITPKISIIVPVYNVEKYLRRCLDSIVAQTFTDWECICVDDGSPDNSGKILDEYASKDQRFVIIHKENGGVSSARNAGLDIARGEWIGFVDSDDWIDLQMFSDLVAYAKQTDADVIVFGYALYDGKKDLKKIKPAEGKLDMSTDLDSLWQAPFSKLFKSSILTKVRFPVGITLGEDMFFTFQVYFANSNIIGLGNVYYHYFQNVNSITHSLGYENIMHEYFVVKSIQTMIMENGESKKWSTYLNMRKLTVKNRFLVSTKFVNWRL